MFIYQASEICDIANALVLSRVQAWFGSACALLVLETHFSALGGRWVLDLALGVLAVPFSALQAQTRFG